MSGERAAETVLAVAVPSPLRKHFDYLPPLGGELPPAGVRVRVPFGRRRVIGVVLGRHPGSSVPTSKLRHIEQVVDRDPILDGGLLRLLSFTSDYFQHPIGEVMSAMLPAALRKGGPARRPPVQGFRLTDTGRSIHQAGTLRGERQKQVLERLALCPDGAARGQLAASASVLTRLQELGCIESWERAPGNDFVQAPAAIAGPEPSEEQRDAVSAVLGAGDGFAAFLLQGVTGSGKTEVYLRIIEQTIRQGKQALVLIPEIGLTPQTVLRFEQRLGVRVAAMHSGLTESERFDAWIRAREGRAAVVVGTRSAVFCPLPEAGVIIVDEEHDLSFKQQDGVRYSARDLAVLRARHAGVPIVLGSATPSMESLHNVNRGRYRSLRLTRRAGGASTPRVEVVDLRGRAMDGGLSVPLLEAIEQCLASGEQAIMFVNRRGYAPILLCRECGAMVDCERCDAHLVLHRDDGLLHCHHCGHQRQVPPHCNCDSAGALRAVGLGTQRVVETLVHRFPRARVARVDRDATRQRGAMAAVLERVGAGALDLLVGTQMLAKGHDFPAVTLVGVLDGDAGLFSTDFRASERMAQLITQVAGRAGRARRPGRVLIQTHHPDNPLLRTLVREGYDAFARNVLHERETVGLPPFGVMALLRAEAVDRCASSRFLDAAKRCAPSDGSLLLLGPVPSPMQRRAGRHRSQLLVEGSSRAGVHGMLKSWIPRIAQLEEARRVRWSVDVDPQEMS